MGENGIIGKAKLAKNMYANSMEAEQDAMDELFQEYANAMAGEGSVGDTTNEIETPTVPEEPKEPYADNTLVNIPKTTDGMTPVKYNSTSGKWEKADTTEEWYNYDSSKKEWANVVLGDATFVTENGVEVLDESKPYSQLVWIPRYAYKITTMYHTASTSAGNIDVVFIGTNNKDKNGTEYTRDTAAEYPTATAGETTGMSDYVVHPAFDYGDTKLEGFWVGKFESSNTSCDLVSDENFDVTSGETTYTGTEVMTVRANVTSWRNITIGDSFSTCLAMNSENNPYGLSSDDSIVDPHLTKNSEWGAVAYLSQSVYGKNAEVWNNSNTSYITGMAGSNVNASSENSTNAYNIGNGPQASTTGNIYGVYDMSGGTWERVAAYINNGDDNLIANGGDLVASGMTSKYRNVYTAYDSNGNITIISGKESQQKSYEKSAPVNGKYGEAIYETSANSTSPWRSSWYSDCSGFPNTSGPFFIRGSGYSDTSNAGLFYFDMNHGLFTKDYGFRVVVPVLK